MAIERVVLVGGSGFLGLHLIEAFLQLSPRPDVHVFDVRPVPTLEGTGCTFDSDSVTVHIGDLASEDDVKACLEKAQPDVVVHSASPVHGLGPAIYEKVNVDGTRTLLKVCKGMANPPVLVYTSSAGVVFNGANLYGVDESWPFPYDPIDAYNLTKEKGEKLVVKATTPEFKTIALRPAGIFGPGDRQMIPALRTMAQRGQHKIQLGDNLNLFDVTYVGNVAHSHVLAAQKLLGPEASLVAGQAYFITNDEPIYFWSFAKQIWKHDGYVAPRQYTIPGGLGVALGYLSQWVCGAIGKEPSFTAFRVKTATATRYYDISKAKALLGYKPQWTLQEALAITLNCSTEKH